MDNYLVITGCADMRRTPGEEFPLESQALFGQGFDIQEEIEKEGKVWARGFTTRGTYPYSGYVERSKLGVVAEEATHRVSAVRTIAYAKPDVESEPCMWLSMNALGTAEAQTKKFTRLAGAGWVFSSHLAPFGEHASDWVAEAEKFLGTPYRWGGVDANYGVDCSAVIYNALRTIGRPVERNSYGQSWMGLEREEWEGREAEGLVACTRSDLVFWHGHVGVMLDERRLLHATADRMQVVIEDVFEVAARRLKEKNSHVTAIKNFDLGF